MQKQLFNLFFLSFSFFSFSYEESKKYMAHETPTELEGIGVVEHLGESIDLNLSFQNSEGRSVQLKKYFSDLPVLMTVVYYNCPSLCNFHLNGLFTTLNRLSFQAGKDYQFLIVSMDATEGPSLASAKKSRYLKKFSNVGSSVEFLTGSKESIDRLTKQLGFSFRWDDETDQFAHSPVAYLLSPKEAIISRYLYGVEFDPQTLKISFLEASQGKIGNIVDRILLFCYRFNPKKNRYTLYAYNIMRLGGALTILLLLFFLIPFWMKENKGKG